MKNSFHLSLPVKSIDDSIKFYEGILGANVKHRDPSGYVNIDLYGHQITLQESPEMSDTFKDFHFGVNLTLEKFNSLSEAIIHTNYEGIVIQPKVVDEGTALERKKMFLKCPTGYLVELKGLSTF